MEGETEHSEIGVESPAESLEIINNVGNIQERVPFQRIYFIQNFPTSQFDHQ